MDFAGGVARLSGNLIETEVDLRFGNNGAVSTVSTTTVEPVEFEWAPLLGEYPVVRCRAA